ncbi:MAG TPA: GAF domain-containing protein [Nitrospirae bacterium]|nr:GAF domain-containing protein [Nitrospirota bacterium]
MESTANLSQTEIFEKKLSILREISSVNVLTDNLSTIVNLMLELAINYTDAEKGSIMLLNSKGELYIYAARGMKTEFIKSYRVKVGEGIAGHVARTMEPVMVQNIEEDPRFKQIPRDRYKTNSFISCPIISKNRLLGVLNINDKRNGEPFTDDDFSFIKIIANHAAVALENAFLMNQLRAKAAELEEINKKLIDSDVVKTEFITRLSHELRTPLNSVKGSIYYLQQSPELGPQERLEFYDIIASETGKMISIVENLLNFLRLEDEMKLLDKRLINIKDVLDEVSRSKLITNRLSSKNIELRVHLRKTVSDIVADKIRTVQFFINMLDVIASYLELNDKINITVDSNNYIDITIEASRPLPENITVYFKETRSIYDQNQPDEKLKLYLARKIAENHRWSIDAYNTESSFVVKITIPESSRNKIIAVVDSCMDKFVDLIAELLEVNTCSVMLSDEITGDLTIKSARGLNDDVIKRTRIKFGDRIAGWVAVEGKPLFIEDIEKDPRFGRKNTPRYTTKSLISLPIKVNSTVVGVVNLNNKKSNEPFSRVDLYIATELTSRISKFLEKLYKGNIDEEEVTHFITTLENLIFVEKRYTKKQPLLPNLMTALLEELGVDEETKRIGTYISVLYDLGLMTVDERVLSKKKLLPSEERTVKIHPFATISLLNNFEYSEEVRNAILHHHERYDGTGYPDGLKGKDIPFLSRVLAVVDSYCAMISDRPYKKPLTDRHAIEELKKGAGTLYDPEIVDTFVKLLKMDEKVN